MTEILLGGVAFRSKRDLRDKFRVFFASLNGKTITNTSHGSAFSTCLSLFSRHPNWAHKSRKPIASIRVSKSWGSIGSKVDLFYTDGSSDDISWTTACNGRPKSKVGLRRGQMRRAISTQIIDFYAKSAKECASCNTRSGPFEVDHLVSFTSLAKEYESTYGSEDITLSAWYDFHQEFAKLQLLCLTCHSQKTRKEKVKPNGQN